MSSKKYLIYASAIKNSLLSKGQQKHLFRLLDSFQPDYTIKKAMPWIPFDAIDFIGTRSSGISRVFEYGSGGSTLFWMERGISCVSIEHDRHWYERMKKLVGNSPLVDLRLAEPELGCIGAGNPGVPSDYASSDASGVGKNYRHYASQIDEFPEASFDLVLIDGRARPSCIRHSASKVRLDGMLFVDNSNRPHYFEHTQVYLEEFERRRFFGATPGVTFWSELTVFIKRRPADWEEGVSVGKTL